MFSGTFKVIRSQKHFEKEGLVLSLEEGSLIHVLGSLPHNIFGKQRQISKGGISKSKGCQLAENKKEQFVLERSARLNLDPDRGDWGDWGDLDDRGGGGGSNKNEKYHQVKVTHSIFLGIS